MAERLNWGCGPTPAEGWVNSDVVPWLGMRHGRDHVGPAEAELPWADETFDYVVGHHVLQMVSEHEIQNTLRELHRVTKPGGLLRLSVPDTPAAITAWWHGQRGWFPLEAATTDDALCVYLTQGGGTRSLFTASRLFALLLRAGWPRSWRTEPGRTRCPDAGILELDSRPGESIYVEAQR